MTYYYFFSYAYVTINNAWGYGNVEINTDSTITSLKQVRVIEEKINKQLGCKAVIVLNYSLLREEQGKINVEML